MHSAKGAVDGAAFVLRLANPLDEVLSKPGQSAWEQVDKLGRSAVDYTVQAVRDPSMVRRDLGSAARAFRVDHDPTATPMADTFVGELKRGFNLGMNNGELAFDAGSLLLAAQPSEARPVWVVRPRPQLRWSGRISLPVRGPLLPLHGPTVRRE